MNEPLKEKLPQGDEIWLLLVIENSLIFKNAFHSTIFFFFFKSQKKQLNKGT